MVQRCAGSRLTQALPFRSSSLQGRPPRTTGDADLDILTVARPVNFPQFGIGGAEVRRLPDLGSAHFGRLLRSLRRRRNVSVDPDVISDDGSAHALLVLAASGAPLRLARPSADMDLLLGSDFRRVLTTAPFSGEWERERHSVRLRRVALDRLRSDPRPGVAVVLATRRPEFLGFALDQISSQRCDRPQVLLGLHGDGWPDDLGVALPDGAVLRRYDESWSLGAMLQDLTLLADASLVTKWDDDDWYGPNHVRDLVDAYEYSGADIVGKAAEYVRLEESDLTIRRFAYGAETYSWTLAGGAMMTSKRFLAEIGGWPDERRGVDAALLAAARAAGGCAYRTHGFEYILRRSAGGAHTWHAPDDHFLETASERRPGLALELADLAQGQSGPPSSS